MPDPRDLEHDIALLKRAIERCAETLAPAPLSAAEHQTIHEGIASLKDEIVALNRRLELAG